MGCSALPAAALLFPAIGLRSFLEMTVPFCFRKSPGAHEFFYLFGKTGYVFAAVFPGPARSCARTKLPKRQRAHYHDGARIDVFPGCPPSTMSGLRFRARTEKFHLEIKCIWIADDNPAPEVQRHAHSTQQLFDCRPERLECLSRRSPESASRPAVRRHNLTVSIDEDSHRVDEIATRSKHGLSTGQGSILKSKPPRPSRRDLRSAPPQFPSERRRHLSLTGLAVFAEWDRQ